MKGDLKNYFENFGEILRINLKYVRCLFNSVPLLTKALKRNSRFFKKDSATGLTKGYAHVYFKDEESVLKSIDVENHIIENKKVKDYIL